MNRRRTANRRKPLGNLRFQPRLEPLETRRMLAANLRLLDTQFVDADNNPVSAPIVGEQVRVRVQWEANDVSLASSYVIRAVEETVGGTTITLNSTTFFGQGNGVFTFTTVLGGWYASLGKHYVTVTIDPTNTVTEQIESDNEGLVNYTAASPGLPEKFGQPLKGEQNVDWSIVNYVDLDPRVDDGINPPEYREYLCDDGPLPNAYKCGAFTEDQNNGMLFTFPNYASTDEGQPVYAVADGQVAQPLQGSVLNGVSDADQAGAVVLNVGDLNADGVADYLVSAPRAELEPALDRGEVYVVYGQVSGFPDSFDLSVLLPENGGDGSLGFVVRGIADNDRMGSVAAVVGDFNGDSLPDLALGAPTGVTGGGNQGETYLLFGQPTGFGSSLDLSLLMPGNGGNGTLGSILQGQRAFDRAGAALASPGDINGDGLDDLVVGAPGYDGPGFFGFNMGRAYVLYGSNSAMPPVYDLGLLDPNNGGLGNNGFVIDGEGGNAQFGSSTAHVGDIDGDGVSDIMIGAPNGGSGRPGVVYAIFGKDSIEQIADPFPPQFLLSDLRVVNGGDGTKGVVFDGSENNGRAGAVIAGLGDLNGDGVDDFAISATNARGETTNSGVAFFIYGKSTGWLAEMPLSQWMPGGSELGTGGFIVRGANFGDRIGDSLANLGDVTGDGLPDIAVGAANLRVSGQTVGGVYVIFNSASGFPSVIDVSVLGLAGSTPGSLLYGPNTFSRVGQSIAAMGDTNADGLNDILIGAPFASVNGIATGQAYVVYGKSGGFGREVSLRQISVGDPDTLEIDHGNGWITRYVGLDPATIAVRPGQIVQAGQILGQVGSRNNGADASLYFEVRHRGNVVETYLDPTGYWQKPLDYQGETIRSVLDAGITNLDPTLDIEELPSDITTLHPTYNGNVWFWYRISHLNPNDEYQVVWYRPDGTPLYGAYHCMAPKPTRPLFGPRCQAVDASPVHSGLYGWSLEQAWKDYAGTWRVQLFVNGQVATTQQFDVISSPIVPEMRVAYGSLAVDNPILLSGRAQPLDFGRVAVGDPAPTQEFVIQNHGFTALHLSDLVLPTGFQLVGTFPTLINVSDEQRFTIEMDTTTPDQKFGEVRFTTDDPDESSFRFLVSGQVTGAMPAGSPRLDLPGSAASYQWLQSPQILDPVATFADSDSPVLTNGVVKAELISQGTADDRLSIRNGGTTQITTVGTDVLYFGTAIGTKTGGDGTNPLLIALNNQASPIAVQALLRSLTYENVGNAPGSATKYVRISVTDDAGRTSNSGYKAVVLGPSNLNRFPSIASLVASPNDILQPASFSLTANGVIDFDGTVQKVTFFTESNNVAGLQTGAGGDSMLGVDTFGTDGWSITISSLLLPAGNRTGYAVATDDLLGESQPAATTFTVRSPNAAPSIVFLSANPNQVIPPEATTLTANGVSDADGFVTRVNFYRETNGILGLQTGVGGDLLIGSDTSSAGGWNLSYSSNGLPEGVHILHAQAIDNGGAVSLAVSTQLRVGLPPPPGSVFLLSDLYPPTGNGTSGFVVQGGGPGPVGTGAGDRSGYTVSSAGDVNGDGFDDLFIGAPLADVGSPIRDDAGASYVLFGKSTGFDATTDLSALNGVNGFRIIGATAGDQAGTVASAGDVNGDGLGDLLIGAPLYDGGAADSGAAYVVFGKRNGLGAEFDLATINGSNGFRLNGISAGDLTGVAVASAGDVNGDGFADVVVGASGADPGATPRVDAGAGFVVFGNASGFAPSVDLGALNGTNGYAIEGVFPGGLVGQSVASAGDVNGDGLADIIVGAQMGQIGTNAARGSAFVIFGATTVPTTPLLLDSLNGQNGFRVDGLNIDDLLGYSVSSAGDFNNDGLYDLVIGVPGADPGSPVRQDAGSAYVLYGTNGAFAPQFDLGTLNGVTGFRINGIQAQDALGISVASAGDVNGDGFDDLLLGANQASPGTPPRTQAGESFVVFGHGLNLGPTFELTGLNGQNGFRIEGALPNDFSGWWVAGVGDINGDGYDDLGIGAPLASPGDPERVSAGATYILFGRNFTSAVSPDGTINIDALTGDLLSNNLNGRQASDTLNGRGGADGFRGGQGDDVMVIGDLTFRRIVGGRGYDTLRFGGAGMQLDLIAFADSRIRGIEVIDMIGTGDNILTLDKREVLNLSDDYNSLVVIRNSGDIVNIGSGWTLREYAEIGGQPFYVFQQAEAMLAVQAVTEGTPWQNPANPLDVSNDGFVVTQDALFVINYLNANPTINTPLPNPPLPNFAPPPLGAEAFYDVNGDGYASPVDALLVINFLNRIGGGEGNGEGESQATSGGDSSVALDTDAPNSDWATAADELFDSSSDGVDPASPVSPTSPALVATTVGPWRNVMVRLAPIGPDFRLPVRKSAVDANGAASSNDGFDDDNADEVERLVALIATRG